jgi:hypothetical protein
MPIKQEIFAIVISLFLLFFIIELVRRKKLREEYSWLWLLTGSIILILALWYDLLQGITRFIGASLPTSTLFFLGLFFLILIAIQFSVKVSALFTQVKNLAQENGLLKQRIEELEREDYSPNEHESKES